MENIEEEKKDVFTEEEIKIQMYDEIIKDVINEIDDREENIKIYYPYFIINKKLKVESETFEIDLTEVFIGLLSFLLYVGKLSGKKIEYQDIYNYIEYFIKTIHKKEFKVDELKKIVNTILDVAQNNGNNFIFTYYSPKAKAEKEKYLKYIEMKLGENKKLNYYITAQGIDFYLKTKEFPDATQITINLLLFRKQIEKGSFNYAYDTVRRLNIEVKRKIEQKDLILEGLMYGGKEGIKEYTRYHETIKEQFDEEEELFGEVSTLVKNIYTEYISKENTKNLGEKESKTLQIIKNIEKELNKAVSSHTRLLHEAIDMTKKHDEIIDMRAKSAFSEKFKFEQEFENVISKTKNPEKLLYFISPFLLPKRIKTFNPMKSLENQRINKQEVDEVIKEKEEIKDVETIDKITQKRVMDNFKFYFQNLLTLLKTRNTVTLKTFAQFIKQNYGDKSLYNGDFIAFSIYLNRNKLIKEGENEMFEEFHFQPITVIPEKDDIDLENGLKITNMTFKKGYHS